MYESDMRPRMDEFILTYHKPIWITPVITDVTGQISVEWNKLENSKSLKDTDGKGASSVGDI
jgi:hypothetical protein